MSRLIRRGVESFLLQLTRCGEFPTKYFCRVVRYDLFVHLFFLFHRIIRVFHRFLIMLIFRGRTTLPPYITGVGRFTSGNTFPYLSTASNQGIRKLLNCLRFTFILATRVFSMRGFVIFFLRRVTAIFPYLRLTPGLVFKVNFSSRDRPFQ